MWSSICRVWFIADSINKHKLGAPSPNYYSLPKIALGLLTFPRSLLETNANLLIPLLLQPDRQDRPEPHAIDIPSTSMLPEHMKEENGNFKPGQASGVKALQYDN